MIPAQFQRFAKAYAPAVLTAVLECRISTGDETAEEYALSISLPMLDRLERYGLQSIGHYYLNGAGGAFRRTCEALGIPNTRRAIEDFLEGKTT